MIIDKKELAKKLNVKENTLNMFSENELTYLNERFKYTNGSDIVINDNVNLVYSIQINLN